MSNSIDTTCSGTFYDNGGLGLYTSNQNLTQTFCPGMPGSVTKVTFTSFQTDAGLDNLFVYDGPSTASPLIGVYSGNATLNGVSFQSTSASGCLTFNFISNATLNQNGWAATVSCALGCQSVVATLDSVVPTPDTTALKIIRACKGSQIDFFGSANFPQTGTYYNQSIATSTFTWKSGDGFVFTGQNASHIFNTNGTFDVNLIVKDTIGCPDTVLATRVVISEVPEFAGANFFPNDTICLNDTALIVIPSKFIPFQPPVLNAAGITFLPDGTGVSYYDTINVAIFDPTATHQNGFLESILVNMEHSYLGDLDITLTCPNGSVVILKEYLTTGSNGGGTHLGEPVDPGTTPVPLNPGVGYDYDFTLLNPKYGTMVAESNTYQHNFVDVLGNNYINEYYLPAGTYTPYQNFNTNLNGCPLNGDWIITVTDNIGIDNGYIFYWELNFDSLIRPPSSSPLITPETDTSYWALNPTIIAQPYDSVIMVSPTTSGTYSYTYYIEDNVGCRHDTTVDLFVKNKLKSNAGLDFTTCKLDYQLAPIPTLNNDSAHWSFYSSSATGNSVLTTDTSYNANTLVNEFSVFNYILNEIVEGCPTFPDTVTITHIEALNTIDIAVNKDTICIPELVTFTNNSNMLIFDSIYWEFGDGNTSNTQGTTSHTYNTINCFDLTVTLVNSLGCKVDSVLQDIVCAYPTPIANFNYTPFEPIVPETRVNFTNTSSGATIYVWDFAGLGFSSLTDDSYEFPKTEGGTYPVTLYVSNEGGCSDQITKMVTIKNPLSIWIPTAFTPNGDGLNETFRVVFNNDAVEKYSLNIFNRWGELLFYSEDPDFEWDGTFEGKEAPSGVYIWQINGKEEFETESFTKFGHVTLTR